MTFAPRLRWLVLICAGAAVLGIAAGVWMLTQVSLAILLWIGWEWFAFRWNLVVEIPRVRVTRQLQIDDTTVETLWKNRPASVVVQIAWPRLFGHLYVELTDLVPPPIPAEGKLEQRLVWGQPGQTELSYSVRPDHAGSLHWVGVRVRMFDLHGFFRADRVLPAPQHMLVLPPLLSIRNADRLHKRLNQLPPPGHHRHVRPGMGSELLEIREYVPGDSPRSIAWKLSARRDTLMTKQYESEVPVRVRLIVDAGPSVRWRFPYVCPYTALIELAGLISETMVANRDSVGLSLWNEGRIDIIQPASRRQTPLQIVKKMLNAFDTPWTTPRVPVDQLIPAALRVLQSRFPELCHGPLEGIPVGWRPWGWKRRATLRTRYALSLFLSGYFRLPHHELSQLIAFDDRLGLYLQRFLYEQQVPYLGPLYGDDGKALLADPSKPDQLARLVTHAVAHARDNELLVLMADLADLEDRLAGLEQAVKLAVARHHRVILLTAWPPDTPTKLAGPLDAAQSTPDLMTLGDPYRFAQFARQTELARRTTLLESLRQRFGRFRVPVVAATLDDAPQLILQQAELLRAGRSVA
ncbi:MAG: DUF58 domain-containing protein [Pirellulales bacterium]